MSDYQCISADVRLGAGVRLSRFVNLYGCCVGDGTKVGAFVEIQKNASVGRNCKISSHSFICEGVTIEDDVFVGHNVTFINDRYPRATNSEGALQTEADWKVEPTVVQRGASIGSGATICSGVVIGEGAMVGAGSVVTRSIPAHAVVAGNPARILRFLDKSGLRGNFVEAVPFLDLATPHAELEPELVNVFRKALHGAAFVGGSSVAEFESAFAAFCGTGFAAGVSSGTDALRFAIMACGVRRNDVVLTVPNSFIATAEAISQAGAIPEFIDVDSQTCNLSARELEKFLQTGCASDGNGRLISRRHGRPVTAVIPVHLYGQMADMDPILRVAGNYGLTVIEDACQAHGAWYGDRRAGSFGHGVFSLYGTKNMTTGEGGLITTDDDRLADWIRMYRNQGMRERYHHEILGYNFRLTDLAAAIGLVQLDKLDRNTDRRRSLAARYDAAFADLPMRTPVIPSGRTHVFHQYTVEVETDRDGVAADLAAAGIATAVYYPVPVHRQPYVLERGLGGGVLPVTDRAAERTLSLPMFPGLSDADQTTVIAAVRVAVERRASAARAPHPIREGASIR